MRNIAIRVAANSGPMKLWPVFDMLASNANSVCPKIGNSRCLPNSITMPVRPSTTKHAALSQCTARSTTVNRSIIRPVGGPDNLICPRYR